MKHFEIVTCWCITVNTGIGHGCGHFGRIHTSTSTKAIYVRFCANSEKEFVKNM